MSHNCSCSFQTGSRVLGLMLVLNICWRLLEIQAEQYGSQRPVNQRATLSINQFGIPERLNWWNCIPSTSLGFKLRASITSRSNETSGGFRNHKIQTLPMELFCVRVPELTVCCLTASRMLWCCSSLSWQAFCMKSKIFWTLATGRLSTQLILWIKLYSTLEYTLSACHVIRNQNTPLEWTRWQWQ